MKIIKFLKPYLSKYKGWLFLFIFLSLTSKAIAVVFPYLTGSYIDLLIQKRDISAVFNITFWIISLGVIKIFSSYLQGYLNVKIQANAMTDLNFDVLKHLVKMPIRYFENKDSGYLNHRVNTDSSVVVNFLLNNLLGIIINALTIIILLSISFKINFKMTLILIPLFPLYLFLYYIFRKPLYERNYDLKESQNNFFSKMNQHLQNISIIKINATFEESHEIIENSFNKMYTSLLKHTKLSLLFSNSNSITMVMANGLIFFFGGREVLLGNMSIGQFTIINSYFSMIMGSISYFLNFGDSYQKSLVSYNRIKEILDHSVEINGENLIDKVYSIKLKNLSFSYNEDGIITKLNQEFNKGKIYCIIGNNGTGKSTLVNLILGIYSDYYKGNIYYNDKELKELDMYSLRKNIIGVSQQEPKTINIKMIDNIKYGLKEFNYTLLESLLKTLDLDMSKFSNGMETILNEGSSNISGGERLKISLIRNFLKEPEILILDEPTSALDVASVKKLKELVKETKKNRITIIITHDYEFLKISDEVIELSGGTNKVSGVS